MRMRNNSNAENELLSCRKYLSTKELLQEKIINKEKINIEIGMGKGDFISKLAHDNPDITYIGVELCKSVLALAIKKIERYEQENNVELTNLYLMSFDAIEIEQFFNANQLDIIYLNFSDPWPKYKHRKRRLTHENFLKEYIKVLKKDGYIRVKTDNIKLFEFTIVSMNNFGFKYEEVYLNLHSTNVPNIMTEYERKFCEKGPIYMLVAKNK